LLFVGRITFNKGLHVLLESLHYLKRKVHLLIIGSKWDPAYFREIEERIRYENRTHNHKITILGEKEPNDMVKWYQRASILVSPSFEEALSMSNLEAMSCGTPVISTSVGGIPEIIQHGKNGLLVPPNRPVELAYAIDSMLSNGELRKMISREAREIVEANYSKKMIIRKLRRIYEEMAS
jgi:glycosyltransferase involved in cell wall biosynthesis